MFPKLTAGQVLPADGFAGTLVGRALFPGVYPGPCVVVIREDGVMNISGTVTTMTELLNSKNPLSTINKASRNCINLGSVDDLLANSTPETHDPTKPYFLTPIDLHAVKGTGKTFVSGMLRRVIEGCDGAISLKTLEETAGADIEKIMPNTDESRRAKFALDAVGLWGDSLEVAFGPDSELFTKAQPLSSVGLGAEIGVHPDSKSTFAEPEVVMMINAEGNVCGVTLGLDVTLRDVSARSNLLFDRAKDNNASCAVGPFIRLFDNTFSLANVQGMKMTYAIEGPDGVVVSEDGSMNQLSRNLHNLTSGVVTEHHGYPDGVALFTGCMFQAPATRGTGAAVFAHKVGDIVTVKSAALGAMTCQVNYTNQIRRWNFGIADLMHNFAHRHLFG